MVTYAVRIINTKPRSYATDAGKGHVADRVAVENRLSSPYEDDHETCLSFQRRAYADSSGKPFFETVTTYGHHLQKCPICVDPFSRVRSIAWRITCKLNAMSTIDTKSITLVGFYQPPFTNQPHI